WTSSTIPVIVWCFFLLRCCFWRCASAGAVRTPRASTSAATGRTRFMTASPVPMSGRSRDGGGEPRRPLAMYQRTAGTVPRLRVWNLTEEDGRRAAKTPRTPRKRKKEGKEKQHEIAPSACSFLIAYFVFLALLASWRLGESVFPAFS